MQLGSDTVVARTKPGMLLTIILILTLLLLPEMISGAESFQKIRVGLPSLALTYMPFYVAQEKGLLRKSGLEAEYIQMNTGIQPQAIMGGNINFFPLALHRDPGGDLRSPARRCPQFLRTHAVDARDH